MLERVERARAFADLALHSALARADDVLTARDRAFATELVYGTLRWRGRLDYLLDQVSDRELADLDATLRTLLRLGAYQLLFTDRVPASAAVDQTVRLARAADLGRATGFVNAVLRQLARRVGEGVKDEDRLPLPELARDPLAHLMHALSLPEWIAKRWLKAYGPVDAAALARASNAPPPLCARVNPLRAERQALLDELRARRPEASACTYALAGVQLGHHGNPESDPAFLEGRLTIQDEASQLVVVLLDPQPGERILDLCAAPGVKTTAIAEQVGPSGSVTAVDRNERRLGLVGRSCRRLGLENVVPLHADIRDEGFAPGQLPGAPFDRVLLDAPCTGLGTLRRNPDARWRLDPDDPARLARTQATLLKNAAAAVSPGATLVYSTCTITPEENEDVVQSLLASDATLELAHAQSEPLSAFSDERGFIRTWPHRHGMDGFFVARIARGTVT